MTSWIAAVLPPAAILFSAFVGGSIALVGIRTQREIARKKEALNFLAKSESDGDLIEARQVFLRAAAKQGGLVGLIADGQGGKEFEQVRVTLNDLELMAVGVAEEIIDFEIVFQARRGMIIDVWERSGRLVEELRSRTGKSRLYGSLEDLYVETVRVSRLRSLSDRGSAQPVKSWRRPGGRLESVR